MVTVVDCERNTLQQLALLGKQLDLRCGPDGQALRRPRALGCFGDDPTSTINIATYTVITVHS